MKALLHFADAKAAPVGVWWVAQDTSYPESYYAEPTSPWKVKGAQVMSWKNGKVTWDEYFNYLQDGSSPLSLWEVVETKAWEPKEYLEYTRERASKSVR